MPSRPVAETAAAGPRRRAGKRDGPATYAVTPQVRVASDEGTAGDSEVLAARIRLLEGLVGRAEIADCTQFALQWLGEVLGVTQSICLVRPEAEPCLIVVGASGMPGSAVASYTVSLEEWGNPLVTAFTNRKALFFPAGPHSADDRRRRPATPFEDGVFHVVPLGVPGLSDNPIGLLLVGGTAPLAEEFHWFTAIFSRKLDQVHYRKMRIAEVQGRAESDRLNLIIDSVADPIVVTDAVGATSLMNKPAERLFAIPAQASAIEQRWVQANDAHFSSFIADMLVSPDRRRVGEIGLSDPKTGEPMPVEAIAGKMLSEHGELTAVVTILHDRREAIEKARLYEQLKQASDELERKVQAATADIAQQNELLRRQAIELEQASALKSQFLANMSHELRTPLNAMLGYTSMLLQGVAGCVDPPVKRRLGRIESNGRHLLTIINEILDISRIEAGRMPLQLSTFRVPDLVSEVKAELEPIIMRSKLVVTLDLPKDLTPISSDRQKVKQILLNLLSNALKFTHDGCVTIAAGHNSKERTVTLSVTDTGIGIAHADQHKIFEDFRQLDNSPTRAYGGTGLGLSICRRLAQMLDGRISVESQVGKGSTFTLALPTKGRK